MRLMKYILILSILFLSGCSWLLKKPETKIEYVTKTVLITAPKGMLTKCVKEPPPDKDSYIKAQLQERERLLTDLTIRLYTEIDKCNLGLTSYDSWLEKELKLHPKQE